MKIGITGPISIRMLAGYLYEAENLPKAYDFPQTALLAQGLLNRGHDVTIYALGPEVQNTMVFNGDKLTIHVCPMRRRARFRALDFFREERKHLVDAMMADPCDIIHAHWTYEFALATLSTGIPSIITARDAPYKILQLMPNSYRFIRLLMAHRVAWKAPNLTANSPYTARHFKKYMFHRRPIAIVPNLYPPDLIAGGRLERKENDTIIFASILTGWAKLKNTKNLLKAFALVKKDNTTARLLLFGHGHGRNEEAEKWATLNSLVDGVEFIGQINHSTLLSKLRSDVDILVHPALEESFGNTLVEAMALAIPVIAGEKSGAVPWVLAGGKAGILVDVKNVNKLAGAMLDLGKDKTKRDRIGKIGRKEANSRFSSNSVVRTFEQLYLKIIEKQTHE